MSGPVVTRCVCHDVSFADLIEEHRGTGATLEQLAEKTGCGTGCGMCKPYIEIAISKGLDAVPVQPITNGA